MPSTTAGRCKLLVIFLLILRWTVYFFTNDAFSMGNWSPFNVQQTAAKQNPYSVDEYSDTTIQAAASLTREGCNVTHSRREPTTRNGFRISANTAARSSVGVTAAPTHAPITTRVPTREGCNVTHPPREPTTRNGFRVSANTAGSSSSQVSDKLMADNTVPTKHAPSASTPEPNAQLLCLHAGFGRNCNQMLQLANVLGELNNASSSRVGLNGANWDSWYSEWFDRDDDRIVPRVDKRKCTKMYNAKDAHFMNSLHVVNRPLMHLLPKRSIRDEAEKQVQLLRQNSTRRLVSVHRRHMEGACDKSALQPGANWCQSNNESVMVENLCNITYDNITSELLPKLNGATSDDLIVLFTDGQVPELDDTFPIQVDNDKIDFKVQLWMMVLTDVHFGIPFSSVDHVVNHWRQGRNMHPSNCFHIDGQEIEA